MNKTGNISPPHWVSKFLKLYCRNDLLEEIQGDVHELFSKRIEEEGSFNANRRFVWDVLRFFRWTNIINSNKFQFSNNTIDMIKNYFKVGFRNILKNKLPSGINIFGLSAAIGVAIVAFLFLDWQYNLDSFHQNSKNIYQVSSFMNVDGEVAEWGITPEPLSNAIKSDIPSVVATTRVDRVSGIFSYGDKVFNERVQFVDQEFMEIFSFPITTGRRDALKDKNAIIISEDLAIKYFGEDDPIGKQVTLTFDRRIKESFFVKAVTKNIDNTSFPFDILINYELKNDIEVYNPTDDWRNFADATFVQLEAGTVSSDLIPLLDRYRQLQNEANGKWSVEKFEMIPLEDLSERSAQLRQAISFGNQPEGNISIAITALLLLILACFNYMNVAIVSATTRLKEIALRKVIGGGKTEIIIQFLTENILLCSLSLLVGLGLAYYLLLPGFNSGFPFTVPFEFSSNVAFFSFFGGILLFTAIISGAYPAFYISSFSPVNIFSGKEKFGRKSWLTKIFLTFQFMVAFWVMVSGFIFTEAANYFKGKDWGYNQEAIIVIPIDGEKHFNELKNKFAQNPDIISVAGSRQHIARSTGSTTIEVGTDKHQVNHFDVGFDYLETMGLRLSSGRFFSENIESDKSEHVVVNQKFVEKLNWDNPLEQTFWYDSIRYSVIGVIEDFHYRAFYSEILPSFMRITDEAKFNFIASKVESGSVAKSRDFMKQTWKTTEPDLPYEGFIQDEVFDDFFTNVDANGALMVFISIMALVLACMGLFGLVAFNINRRMKEYSIRKILGANMRVITKSISNDFIWMLIIAMILGAPLGFVTMDGLFTLMYADREPIGIAPFLVSAGAILLTAVVTVSTQVRKVAKTNPVDMIRNE